MKIYRYTAIVAAVLFAAPALADMTLKEQQETLAAHNTERSNGHPNWRDSLSSGQMSLLLQACLGTTPIEIGIIPSKPALTSVRISSGEETQSSSDPQIGSSRSNGTTILKMMDLAINPHQAVPRPQVIPVVTLPK